MPLSFFTPTLIFASAILLRTILLFYGLVQDKYSPLPYTDIDYFVFTDAARYIYHGYSPYNRDTYRYPPVLAWLLVPTAWPGPAWFSFGKVLFALADIIAGWLIVLLLKSPAGGNMMAKRALKFASIWLLNPIVATISTRGSSEGLLGVMVVGLLWAVLSHRILLAGMLLGLAVHFKIYPFIYGLSIIWFLESSPDQAPEEGISPPAKCSTQPSKLERVKASITPDRITLLLSSLATFTALNILMYSIYSTPFLKHTFLHHLTRIDHRHNFSPYNTLLHLSSANPRATGLRFESLAFLPQLILSAVLIPLALAKKDLAGTMLAQTFAFVAFNKVCTSQVRNRSIFNTSNIALRNLCLPKGHFPRGLLLRKFHNI
jgi:phosphatidylinositol glycan class M